MSNLKSIGIGVFLIGIAFGLPSITSTLGVTFSQSVQLIMQLGIIVAGLYYIAGDEY